MMRAGFVNERTRKLFADAATPDGLLDRMGLERGER
jgi:hypothetical protein